MQTDTVRSESFLFARPEPAGSTFYSLGFHIGGSSDPCDDVLFGVLGISFAVDFSPWANRNFYLRTGASIGNQALVEAAVGYRSVRAWQTSIGFSMIRCSECEFYHNGSWLSPNDEEFSPAIVYSLGFAGTGFLAELNVYSMFREMEYFQYIYYPAKRVTRKPVVVALRFGWAW